MLVACLCVPCLVDVLLLFARCGRGLRLFVRDGVANVAEYRRLDLPICPVCESGDWWWLAWVCTGTVFWHMCVRICATCAPQCLDTLVNEAGATSGTCNREVRMVHCVLDLYVLVLGLVYVR